ncbi:MAG: class I SAM-dependent methyltransferase [Steroidobacteraceae bacterium]
MACGKGHTGVVTSKLLALEPDPRLIGMARKQAPGRAGSVRFLEASAEQIPLESASIDTIISTWRRMCSILNIRRALEEMPRVLKRDGRLLFVEHGLSSERAIQK